MQLDAGMHTGREGMSAMPYFDDFDLSTVDILLISQYVPPLSASVVAFGYIWALKGVVKKTRTEDPICGPQVGRSCTEQCCINRNSTNTILFNTTLLYYLKSLQCFASPLSTFLLATDLLQVFTS